MFNKYFYNYKLIMVTYYISKFNFFTYLKICIYLYLYMIYIYYTFKSIKYILIVLVWLGIL